MSINVRQRSKRKALLIASDSIAQQFSTYSQHHEDGDDDDKINISPFSLASSASLKSIPIKKDKLNCSKRLKRQRTSRTTATTATSATSASETERLSDLLRRKKSLQHQLPIELWHKIFGYIAPSNMYTLVQAFKLFEQIVITLPIWKEICNNTSSVGKTITRYRGSQNPYYEAVYSLRHLICDECHGKCWSVGARAPLPVAVQSHHAIEKLCLPCRQTYFKTHPQVPNRINYNVTILHSRETDPYGGFVGYIANQEFQQRKRQTRKRNEVIKQDHRRSQIDARIEQIISAGGLIAVDNLVDKRFFTSHSLYTEYIQAQHSYDLDTTILMIFRQIHLQRRFNDLNIEAQHINFGCYSRISTYEDVESFIELIYKRDKRVKQRQKSSNQRKAILLEKLKERGLRLREESILCGAFIRHGDMDQDADQVADMMKDFEWMHEMVNEEDQEILHSEHSYISNVELFTTLILTRYIWRRLKQGKWNDVCCIINKNDDHNNKKNSDNNLSSPPPQCFWNEIKSISKGVYKQFAKESIKVGFEKLAILSNNETAGENISGAMLLQAMNTGASKLSTNKQVIPPNALTKEPVFSTALRQCLGNDEFYSFISEQRNIR